MQTRDITIQGVIFAVSAPFETGHTCTEAEAHALNQVRSENVRNNKATDVKKAWAELHVDGALPEGASLSASALSELAEIIAAYDADYVFNMQSAGGGKAPKDPIEAEATKMAKAAIAGLVKSKLGSTIKAYLEVEGNKEKYNANVATLATSDAYMKAAKKTVSDREKLASAGIDELEM